MQKVGVRDPAGRFIDAFDLMVQLPWGALTTVAVHHDMTIEQLKSVVEFAVGIPADLLNVGYHRHATLDDAFTLRQLRMIPGDRINIVIEYGYEEIVASAASGNSRNIINDINRHWNEEDVTRRRMVVMFIAAHQGYHYLVDRMLTDGASPDSVSPSGRSALHIACAMGNGGCIDALLQRGANTALKDATNKTPAQVAFSCGQQEAERRLVLYERARARQTRHRSKHDDWLLTLPTTPVSSWSRSPRFPVSRLARSITPTLALQELSLSPAPGPELHVKSLGGALKTKKTKKTARKWRERGLTEGDSGKLDHSSDSNDDSGEEDLPSCEVDVFENDDADREEANLDTSTPISRRDDTILFVNSSPITSPRPPLSPAIRPPHIMRTTAWQPDSRKVRFDEGPRFATSSRAHSSPLPKPLGVMSHLPKTELADNLHHGSAPEDLTNSRSQGNVSNRVIVNNFGSLCSKVSNTLQLARTCATSARQRSQRYNPRYPDERYGQDEKLDNRTIKDIQASVQVSVGLRETTEQPFLSNGRRKVTPEENCLAFNNWLDSKVQGTKDKKLLNNVQMLLDEAFGRADEEMKRQEEKRPKKTGQSYEAWKKMKDDELRNKKKELFEKQRQQEEAQRQQASRDAENELLIKAWIMSKNKVEKKRRWSDIKEKRGKQKRLEDQQQAAQSAFEKWRLNKEWEELVRLREGKDFFDDSSKLFKSISLRQCPRKRIQSAPSLRRNKRLSSKTVS